MADVLRVIDFGKVGALRSQTLWHAIAYGVSEGEPPTLSFMEPVEPYVSIGFHRSVDELDPDVCGPGKLPVFRRMVGGGPVYIDRGQLFFQVTVPAADAGIRRAETLRRLLEPAVAAFNDVGIAARLDRRNEVVVGDRKICGHAGGQIGSAVIVVGNVIASFDHEAAASIVRVPAAEAREEFRRQMTRFVMPTPADFGAFVAAATRRYAAAFDLPAAEGDLGPGERTHLDRLDRLFVDPEWVSGARIRRDRCWRAKVKSGVWVGYGERNGRRLTVTFTEGDVRCLRVDGEPREPVPGDDATRVPYEDVLEALEQRDGELAALLSEIAATPPR